MKLELTALLTTVEKICDQASLATFEDGKNAPVSLVVKTGRLDDMVGKFVNTTYHVTDTEGGYQAYIGKEDKFDVAPASDLTFGTKVVAKVVAKVVEFNSFNAEDEVKGCKVKLRPIASDLGEINILSEHQFPKSGFVMVEICYGPCHGGFLYAASEPVVGDIKYLMSLTQEVHVEEEPQRRTYPGMGQRRRPVPVSTMIEEAQTQSLPVFPSAQEEPAPSMAAESAPRTSDFVVKMSDSQRTSDVEELSPATTATQASEPEPATITETEVSQPSQNAEPQVRRTERKVASDEDKQSSVTRVAARAAAAKKKMEENVQTVSIDASNLRGASSAY